MTHPSFKTRLKKGRPALGCLSNMGSPVAAEIIAASGYDAVMTDMEHGSGDFANAVQQFQAITAGGAVPLIRIPANDPVDLKRALDAGPAGVMVPAVSSAAEAAAAVNACRYPPQGIRGVAHSVARASGYGTDVEGYLQWLEAEFLLICQIETMEGVGDVDAIAAVEGVDMLLVGPMDLSASAGHFNDPDCAEMDAPMARVAESAGNEGVLLGTMATAGRTAPDLFEAGYDFVLDTVDIAILREAARAKVVASRKYTRDKKRGG